MGRSFWHQLIILGKELPLDHVEFELDIQMKTSCRMLTGEARARDTYVRVLGKEMVFKAVKSGKGIAQW